MPTVRQPLAGKQPEPMDKETLSGMNIHLDAGSGLAGNMFLAACLDLGLDQGELTAALKTIDLPDWSLEVDRQRRGGIAGLHVRVVTPPEKKHRHLPDIQRLIEGSTLPEPVRQRAMAIFRTLAEAEGAVHGITSDRVHFHEVGAVDAIVDICAAAFAVWRLGITGVTAGPVPTGSGTVVCQHGAMPLPVPAVAELLRRFRVPLRPDPLEMEWVTPTGAAVLVNLADRFGAMDLDRIDRIGHGLGSREVRGRSNALRILAREDDPPATDHPVRERVTVLSAHVDDMNPEWYGPLWERLFQDGALDVALIPMTMKKGRPAVRIEVVCRPADADHLAERVLKHSTAIGVRLATMDRLALPRSMRPLQTPWGILQCKEAGGIWRPEHDQLAALAQRHGWSLPETQQRIAPFLALATTRQYRNETAKK